METICNDDLSLKPIVTIYKDDEDIPYLGGLHTELKEGERLYIVPTIAGGWRWIWIVMYNMHESLLIKSQVFFEENFKNLIWYFVHNF